jgi:signal transduction histidine kinase
MNQLRFRTRLVLILSLFAIVPALLLTLLWSGTVSTALPFVTGRSAWDSVAASGEKAIAAARQAPLTASQRRAIDAHERELRTSVEQARRYSFLATRTVRVIAIAGVLALLVLTGAASRVAGHLSRQLSRPLDELVRWTELIGHGEPLPPAPEPVPTGISTTRKNGDAGTTIEVTTSRVKGAPEFETLRRSMREMVSELAHGRQQAIEAERLHAFRETARRVAHEIKNPLTPIRFALARLRGRAPALLQEDVDVIEIESDRLDRMAKSFAEFGRLPEGPPAEIDMGELVRYTARSCVPPNVLDLDIDENLPRVHGNNGALAGALSNVLLNAVDASPAGGRITVKASAVTMADRAAVRVSVADAGKGIAPENLERIWEPYVTNKPGGTGLGLSIARQAVWAHDGTVNATSTLGRGTEIQLTIPADGGNAVRES